MYPRMEKTRTPAIRAVPVLTAHVIKASLKAEKRFARYSKKVLEHNFIIAFVVLAHPGHT